MKRFLTAFVFAALLAALPAAAFETPVKEEKGKAILTKMATNFQPLAARMGSPHFVWGDFVDGGRVAALVYTPVEKNFKQSPRKVSVAVHALPGKPDEDKKIMNAAAQGLLTGYKKAGKIIKQDVFHNDKDEPALFIEYTMGEGDKKEHNAGVFMRLTPYIAAFIQTQSRGKDLTADDIAKVKSLITAGGNSAKAKPEAGKKG